MADSADDDKDKNEMVSYNNERSGKTEYAPKKQSWFGDAVESVSLPSTARRELFIKRGGKASDWQ